jgi:tRNA pseudouridine55 synthase
VSSSWEGLLLMDKPEGPTSHDIVARVRRATGQRRIGHAGTLDPLASGLLPLVLGRPTRLVRFMPHSPKSYQGVIQIGCKSDTDDITGKILERHEGPLPTAAHVLEAAHGLEGISAQIPPAFSARKIGGRRMYELARQGVQVEAKATDIEVTRFSLSPQASADSFSFESVVSGGTYIRGLARDLGDRLGCGALLVSLRRVAIGPLSIEASLSPSSWDTLGQPELRAALVSPEDIPLVHPKIRLDHADSARLFSNGQAVTTTQPVPSEGMVGVLSPSGSLLGMAEVRGEKLHPGVVLSVPGN